MSIGRCVALVEHPRNEAALVGAQRLVELGHDIVLVTADPTRYATPRWDRPPLTEVVCRVLTCDTRDPAAVARALRHIRNIEVVHSFSHYFTEVAAKSAELLGVAGADSRSITNANAKERFRELTRTKPWSLDAKLVRSASEAIQACESIGYPAVIKPVDGASSTDVALVRDALSASAAWQCISHRRSTAGGVPLAGIALVEEFAAGSGHSVELIRWPEHVEVYGVTDKLAHRDVQFIEQADTFGAADHGCRGLVSVAIDVANTFPRLLGPLHIELVATDSGVRVIEVNPRQGGGHLPTLIELVTGRNVFVDAIHALTGRLPNECVSPVCDAATWWQFYADAAGTLARVEAPDLSLPFVRLFRSNVGPGDAVAPAVDNRSCVGALLVSGASRKEALVRSEALAKVTRFALR